MTCQDCRYWMRWKRTPDGKDQSAGDCRYRPPVLYLEPANDSVGSGWPWIQQDDWCGRWRARVNAEEDS